MAAEQEENCIKTDKAEKKLPFILPEDASHEALYGYDIIKLQTGYQSLQMILEQRERTIMDLRKSLLTSKYEKKSRFLEEALRLDGRSLSPSIPEKRELQMNDIENSTSNAISFEAAVSAGTLGTPCQMGLSSRRNLYLLNLQLREKRKDSGNSDYSSGSIGYNDVKRSLNGRRLKNGPSTPNDENISLSIELGNLHLERTSSLNSQFFKRTRFCGQPLERSRSSDQHLERRKSSAKITKQYGTTRFQRYTVTSAYHTRQSSYEHSSPDSDDAISVISTTSECEKRALMSHHTHTRSETSTRDNVLIVYQRIKHDQVQQR
ncbi:unnamed protein product [Rhizophagus irregularis]|nr:unnamed protein product [Rhizophagus irregularis]